MKDLTPVQAWELLQSDPHAVLIDVRMEIESMYVGRPPGAINIPWYEYPDFDVNPAEFIHLVKDEVTDLGRPVLLLCRSGTRSKDAGQALEQAGFSHVINIVHGFEGERDANQHRSTVNGWRFDGLPWNQM